MSDSPRSGYVRLTLDMPVDVAQWLSSNIRDIEKSIEIAAFRQSYASDQAQQERTDSLERLELEYVDAGRLGARLLRQHGVHKNLLKNKDAIQTVAFELDEHWEYVQQAVLKFYRTFRPKLRTRRNREIARLYEAGKTDNEISVVFCVSPKTVSNVIKAYRATLKNGVRK